MTINQLIESYQRELDNLKFHLKVNGKFLSKCEIERIEVGINDRIHFIQDLKRLLY